MNAFLPTFTILETGYNQGSSGGQSTGGSGADPTATYYNTQTGFIYYNVDGSWYYMDDNGDEVLYPGEPDPSNPIWVLYS